MSNFLLEENAPFEFPQPLPAPTLADIDGDGDLDGFVATNSGGFLLFYENLGDNNFAAAKPANLFDDPPAFSGLNELSSVTPPSEVQNEGLGGVFGDRAKPSIIDIDGDGDLDIFVGEYTGFTYFYENKQDSTGLLEFETPVPASQFGITDPIDDGDFQQFFYASPTFVNVDGDSVVEYAYIGGFTKTGTTLDTALKVYKNQSEDPANPNFTRLTGSDFNQLFTTIITIPSGTDLGVRITPELADFDRDGDEDLFLVQTQVGAGPDLIRYFENTGSDDDPAFIEVNQTNTEHPFRNINLEFSDILDQGVLDIVDLEGDELWEAFLGSRFTGQQDGNYIDFFSTLPEPPEPEPPTENFPDFLIPNQSGGFTVGENGGDSLQLQLRGENLTEIQEVTVIFEKLNGQTISQTIEAFSILPSIFRPNGFNPSKQSAIVGDVDPGDIFRVEIQTLGGQAVFQQVNRLGDGQFRLIFSGGVTLDLQQTIQEPPLGVGDNQRQRLELIDLEEASGTQQATFTLYREADFNNVAGLYRLDDTSGAVAGVSPGEQGYAQAALSNRVGGVNLSVADEAVATASGVLDGETLYGLFIIADGSVEQFLRENPTNSNTPREDSEDEDPVRAYFNFANANPDGADHIRLLGNNIFGFEDLPGGGDLDFNDLIVQVNIA